MKDEHAKILIVDNELEICHLFIDFFDFMGYDSEFETDGKKVLYEIESMKYDVMFLDLNLENISGIDILKKSKSVHPYSEVIVVTGYGSDETVLSTLKFGALSYIQKPISFSEIRVQTEFALATRRYNIKTNKIKNLISEQDRKLDKHFNDIINLDRFSTFLNLSIDFDSLADSMLSGIADILPCKYCSLLFLDDINKEIVIFSHDPINNSTMAAIESEMVRTFESMISKKLDISYNLRVSLSTKTIDDKKDILPELTSASVPIFIENSIQGVLSIFNVDEMISPDELDILHLISIRASRVITNATLHRDTKLLALTDGLTGLLNHRAFHDRMVNEFERHRRYGSFISLIIADFDDLKTINDTYGHPVGDKMLKKVGEILRETSRESDVLARYGGDEFVVLLPQTNMENAR